jgi:phenylacetate-CoA ligase
LVGAVGWSADCKRFSGFMGRLGYGPGALKRFYDRSPVGLQHALTTAYGYRLSWRVYGRAYRRYYAHLERTQWLSRRELERLQLEELRGFLRVAARESSYWARVFAERRFAPDAVCSVDALRALPPLEKEVVREAGDELIARSAREGRWATVESRTSGTTGKALRVVLTRDAWLREHAFRWLHRSWGGIRRGERTATIAGHPVVPAEVMAPPFWRYNAAERQLLFSAQHIGPATVAAYVERLRRFRPVFVHGYPSALRLVARQVEAEGAGWDGRSEDDGVARGGAGRGGVGGSELLRPRAIFTHSETLLDTQREVIERAFGCKVYNWYGTSEHVGNIVECERGSLHVKSEHSLLEFVRADGSPAQPGETAEILATGFGNPAQPLIRYRVGDSVVLAGGECPCGRSGPLVERVEGRIEDFIVTPDGRQVGRLDHVFKKADQVYEAQLFQERVEELEVRIVARPGFGADDQMEIEEELRLRLGPSIALHFRFVPEIARGANGKFRFAVSRVPVGVGREGRG